MGYRDRNRKGQIAKKNIQLKNFQELHLQQAISAQHASSTGEVHVAPDQFNIPIPSVSAAVGTEIFQCTRPKNYKPPKQYVKVQNTLNLEPEQPDYDMDGEDEAWLKQQSSRIEIEDRQFEKIMDRLEKQSEHRVHKSFWKRFFNLMQIFEGCVTGRSETSAAGRRRRFSDRRLRLLAEQAATDGATPIIYFFT